MGFFDGAAGGVFSAGSGLLGSLVNRSAQKSANKTNLEMARQANLANLEIAEKTNAMNYKIMQENNAFNERMAVKMFDLENAYNSPKEIYKRYLEAGINPGVMFGAGNSTSYASSGDVATPVGQPATMVPGAGQIPGHVSPVESPINSIAAFSGIADALQKLTGSYRNSAETKRIKETLTYEIEKLIADTRFADANASYQEWQDEMDRLFGQEMRSNANRKQAKEIEQIQEQIKQIGSEIALNSSKQANFDADTLVKQAEKLMKDAQAKLTQEQYRQLQEQAPVILENLKKMGEKYEAERKAADASANASNASASVSYAQAKQIRETLQFVKDSYSEDIKNKKFERVKFALEKKFQALGIGQNPLNRVFTRVLSDDADFNVSAGEILDWINDNSDR